MRDFTVVGGVLVALYPAARLLLLRGRLLRSAVLAPPFALRRNLQANALIVGDLRAALAAHDVASVLAHVAVLLPRLLAYLIVLFLLGRP